MELKRIEHLCACLIILRIAMMLYIHAITV